MGVLLAVDKGGLVPGPLSLDKSAILRVLGVELGELVALIIGSDIEDGLPVIATDDEGALDDGVVVGAVDGGAAEEVLARSLETVVEATDEVVGHESHGELIVVLVADLPDGVLSEGNVLPEPLEGIGGVDVGVLTLPLIEGERSAGKSLKGVLGLGGLLLSGSGGGGSGLGSLSLLGGDVGQLGGIKESEGSGNGGVDRLVVDSLVPTGDVGELGAPGLVEEELEAAGNDASGEEIGKGDALANKEGVVLEVGLSNGDGLEGSRLSVLNSLLVVGGLAKERAVPGTEVGEDLRVEEREPLQDRGIAGKRVSNWSCRRKGG